MKSIWILGATGRSGRAVAARLAKEGHFLVLVGRDATRLNREAARLGSHVTIKAIASVAEMANAIAHEGPTVVLNMIGPYTHTAVLIANACPPATHYADLSNELPSVQALLALHDRAIATRSTFVTGAGFGVLATESVVLKLCEGQPPAAHVRCAAIPAVASEPGLLGEALASSITEGLVFGGRRYDAGQLVRMPLMGDFQRIALPDGRVVGTASAPTGELAAAQRASRAASAVSATSMVPSSAIVRAVLPALLAVMKIPSIRRFAIRKIAAIELKPATVTTPLVSWSHAQVTWSSGEKRQGWMRTGDAMVFTAEVMANVAARLMQGDVASGAYTPGALFGADFVRDCGGEIIIERHEER